MSRCQSLVVSPSTLFISINSIDDDINNFISKLEVYMNISNTVLSEADRQSLQDLQYISDWSVKWEMPYDTNNCHSLQVGSKNIKDYEICSIKVKTPQSVKDLGITST